MLIFAFAALFFLSGVLLASLQLPLSLYALLLKFLLGRRRNLTKLSFFFLLGLASMTFLILSSLTYLLSLVPSPFFATFELLLFSVLLILSLLSLAFYYRPGPGSVLWLPRACANFLGLRSARVDSAFTAFSLGLISLLFELPLSAPLFLLAALALLRLPSLCAAICLILFSLLVVLPLVIFSFRLKTGQNLARLQSNRLKNKTFIRVFIALAYAVLATFFFAFIAQEAL